MTAHTSTNRPTAKPEPTTPTSTPITTSSSDVPITWLLVDDERQQEVEPLTPQPLLEQLVQAEDTGRREARADQALGQALPA